MKKTWKLRRNAEAVSPVIATILMVAITVVLAAVLYVMVMGFSQGGGANTPSVAMTKSQIGTPAALMKYRISLISITSTTVKPTDITIVVTTTGATPTPQAWNKTLGATYLGAGDYFDVWGMTLGVSYTIMLRYIPTSNSMGTVTFIA